MKLVNALGSLAVISGIVAESQVIAQQRNTYVPISGVTTENSKLFVMANSTRTVRSGIVDFTYMVRDSQNNIAINDGLVICSNRTGWLVYVDGNPFNYKWVSTISQAGENMINYVCNKAGR
jgi:hypothetical protein